MAQYFSLVMHGQRIDFAQNEYGTITILQQSVATEDELAAMELDPQHVSKTR